MVRSNSRPVASRRRGPLYLALLAIFTVIGGVGLGAVNPSVAHAAVPDISCNGQAITEFIPGLQIQTQTSIDVEDVRATLTNCNDVSGLTPPAASASVTYSGTAKDSSCGLLNIELIAEVTWYLVGGDTDSSTMIITIIGTIADPVLSAVVTSGRYRGSSANGIGLVTATPYDCGASSGLEFVGASGTGTLSH